MNAFLPMFRLITPFGLFATSLYILSAPNISPAASDERGIDAKPLEIARAGQGVRPASMSLLCANGNFHLLVVSRLPGLRSGMDGAHDVVSVYVGPGIDHKFPVVADLLVKGGNGEDETGPPDRILTQPLSEEQLNSLERWFDEAPPTKVAFVGFLETGVFMQGAVTGRTIHNFRSSCASDDQSK
jgi:hypothetical protein